MYQPLYRDDKRDWKYYLFGEGNSYVFRPLQRQLKSRAPVPEEMWATLRAPKTFVYSVLEVAESVFGLPESRLIPDDNFELVVRADDDPYTLGPIEFFVVIARITESSGWEQDVFDRLLPLRLGEVIEHFYAVKCGQLKPGEGLRP